MKQSLKEFFINNPEANEVHVALGYFCTSSEEARKKLAGVQAEATIYTREQVDEMLSDKATEPLEHELFVQFKKLPVSKMKKQLGQQEEVVAKLEASFKSEPDQAKAKQALDFHWKLLGDMQDALKAKEESEL